LHRPTSGGRGAGPRLTLGTPDPLIRFRLRIVGLRDFEGYCGFEGGAGAYDWVRGYGAGAYGPGAYCEGGADAYGGGGDGGNGSGSPVASRQRQQPAKTTEPTAKAMPTMIRITEEP
jgi:hypothetical protein